MTGSSATALRKLTLLALTLAGAPAAAQDLFIDSGQNLGTAIGTAVALGDVDGDGDPDAFVANSDGPSAVWINQGAAQGGVPGVFVDSGQALGAAMDNLAQDVALGDLDGDGDRDAFVVRDSDGGDSNEVWINLGGAQGGTEGVFQLNGQIFGDSQSSAVALGDVDGDADLDAFVTRSLGNADKVWLNDGSGQFSDSGQALGSDGGVDVALGDVDGDSDLDAFVANGAANKVWLNQGGAQMGAAGAFADSGQTLGSVLSLSVALGDVDGDSDLDAYVGNSGADTIWLNNGSGTFSDSGQALGGVSQTRDLALANLDGDSDLDVFLAKGGPNRVLINQGGAQAGTAGVFADAGASLGNSFTEGVALADLDGDGDLDAFAANFDGPDKVWLNGTITVLNAVNPFGWQIEFADVRASTGRGVSLALDSSDNPQVSQIRFAPRANGSDYVILHARFDGVRWLTASIDQAVNVPLRAVTSLALDAAGNPHVAYAAESIGAGGPQLKYARFDGAQWQVEVVDASTDVEAHVSLALDGADNPHISYARDPGNRALHYAFFDGAMWQTEQVDATAMMEVGDFNALALDAADEPHIVYHVDLDDDLRYAHRGGVGWTIETVQAGDADGFVDLVVDSAGVPHISFITDFFQYVRYATKPGATWQIQIVTDLGASSVSSHTSLALDSMGRPHVSYAPNRVAADPTPKLEYARRDAGGWRIERIDFRGTAGFYSSLALDSDDSPRIAYSEQVNGDLRFASFDRRWQIQPVDLISTALAPAVTVVGDTLPAIAYHDQSAGLVRSAQWEDEAWMFDPVDLASGAPTEISLVVPGSGASLLYASFYDADDQRLRFGAWDGVNWSLSVIDESADVGRYNRLLLVGGGSNQARIAYWDATNRRLKLARFNAATPNTVAITTNTLSPLLNASSGPLGATVLAGRDIAISYYDGAGRDLRLATWREATGTWSDEPIATAGDVGGFNDIATDGTTGLPVVAYHDATAGAIRYAQRDAGGAWQITTAVANVAAISALGLELGFDSALHGRLAWVDSAAGALRVAVLRNGTWYLETVAMTGGITDLGLAVGHRPHLAVTGAGVGLSHVYRTATLDVATSPFVASPPIGASYNPLDACAAVLELFLDEPGTKSAALVPLGPAPGPTPPLSDRAIFDLLPGHFSATFGGQHYIDLYGRHGSEMGMLALADPQLLSDGYGVLQNFMPGLEALVSGQGDELLISQDMVDDALDLWQRIAAAGSPELAQTINAELAKYNDLQDFVGMSFDEWFSSLIGETIFSNGFE